MSPVNDNGPWKILCDNEGFLRAKCVQGLYKKQKILFWRLPARSPDLNPVEQVWAYLRKQLRAMDLKDATAKKPTLGKMAYTARIRAVMKSKKAQDMASRCALGLKKTCRLVVKNKGAAVPR